jgi:hypothetical protein
MSGSMRVPTAYFPVVFVVTLITVHLPQSTVCVCVAVDPQTVVVFSFLSLVIHVVILVVHPVVVLVVVDLVICVGVVIFERADVVAFSGAAFVMFVAVTVAVLNPLALVPVAILAVEVDFVVFGGFPITTTLPERLMTWVLRVVFVAETGLGVV